MLHTLGKRAASEDVVDLLVECHGRIRKFLGFARALADKPEAPAGEVRAVAGQIRRYFAVALPLHIADEEEAIMPRLAAASDDVTRALAAMHREHAAHAGEIAR
ncbi:MAG: hemerythrin domain-containing protein, partial [Acidobacteriota bacterium]